MSITPIGQTLTQSQSQKEAEETNILTPWHVDRHGQMLPHNFLYKQFKLQMKTWVIFELLTFIVA